MDNGPAEPVIDDVSPPPSPASDPFATFGGPASRDTPTADATRVLMARRLQWRSRRTTILLGSGLAVIVIGAGLATWLLNETTGLSAGNDSLFTAPHRRHRGTRRSGARPGRPGGGPLTAGAPAAPAPKPVAARGPAAAEALEADEAWFDIPATEVASGDDVEASAEPIRIVRGTTTNPVFPKLSEAFAAFQAADFARAEALYREVRAADPGNVDALLGLGALAARGQRTDEAREFYQAVLLAEPRNAAAISAMSTLPAAGARNLDESTLKSLLRDQPGAANLHFALGLQYVAQGRWPDAQMAFFDAVRNEPANADYAYNLAVSLDQLGQSAPATAYYQRALELATASSLFNTGAAGERLATLRSAAP